jgi:hypothetical protein
VLASVVGLLAWRRRDLLAAEIVVPAVLLILFLVSFAQNSNVNNGGTPGMGRYCIWLIPLAIPLLVKGYAAFPNATRWFGAAAAIGVLWAIFPFNPSRPESDYVKATWAARWVWTHKPGLDNPLTEIFAERTTGVDGATGPAATPSCSKVLLIGGAWTEGCPGTGEEPPTGCLRPGAACYANRDGDSYSFRGAPSIP